MSVTEKINTLTRKKIARIAGVLYLLVGITGGFAEGFVDPKIYVNGDAATTIANVLANTGLVRMGVISHLLDAIFFISVALVLYALLRNIQRTAARAMLVFVTLAVGIITLNAVFQFEALRVAAGAVDLSSLGQSGSSALVQLLLDLQHYGTLAAQVFFGLWLVPLGYLFIKSGWFPKALGAVLIAGGACYMIDLFAAFLFPNLNPTFHNLIVIPSAIAEIWTVFYLLLVGVRTPQLKTSK